MDLLTIIKLTERIQEGNLGDVIDEITSMEMTSDTLLKLADSFNRRLKKRSGPLERVEKKAAQKLLSILIESKACPTSNVFPYMYHVAAIYRYLLIQEKIILIDVGEKLLKLHDTWTVAECNELTIFRNNLYAYPWNFLRENHSSLKSVESLKIVSQSLRWLIRQGYKSFSNASHKMHQMAHIVMACRSYEPVENFIKEILYEARNAWLGDLLPQAWEQSALQFDGIFNFIICAIRFSLYFGEDRKAKDLWNEILESFGLYFDPYVTELLEKSCNYFYLFASYLSKQCVTSVSTKNEDDVMVIASQISKLVENSKIPGARLMLSYGFLQGICSLLQSLMREPRLWYYDDTSRDFDRLISALFKLNYIMHTATTHSDLYHLDQKRRDLEAHTYFILLRLISEFITFNKEVTFTMKMIVEKSYDGLKRLITSEQKSRETLIEFYGKINYHGGQIGSGLTRLQDYDGAIKLLNAALDLVDKLQLGDGADNSKTDPTQLAILIADAYCQAKNFDGGLLTLCEILIKYPSLLEPERQTSSVDSLEPISWYNWNYQWISLKRNAGNADSRDLMRKTVADYLLTNKKYTASLTKNDNKMLLNMLYFELNAYFCTKSVIADGLIGVGEALETHGVSQVDRTLGLLAQGIGFWWGDAEQINDAISLFQEGLQLIDNEAKATAGNPTVLLLAALCNVWYALGNFRKFQEIAVAELEIIRNHETMSNPKKYTGMDDDRLSCRVIPAISSLNMGNEFMVATYLTKAVEILYSIVSIYTDTDLRSATLRVGSGITITTIRLLVSVLTAMGAKEFALRSCFVAKTFAEIFKRPHLSVIALSEIMKACPSLEAVLAQPLQKMKEVALSRQTASTVRNTGVYAIYFMRVTLAQAIAFLRSKRYQEALIALREILEYRVATDIFDVGHHILAEAYFVLAEIKLLEADVSLDLGEVPKYLRHITPAGLASKGYKILASVSRTPNPIDSGWNDLYHNYDLLATIMEVSDQAIKHHSLCGKLREARCVAADFIYLAQQTALISRTIDLVIPLAEMDAKSRNFDSCQQKVDCVISMLSGYIQGNEKPVEAKRILEITKKLQMSKEYLKEIMHGGSDSWIISPVSLPEHTFGAYGPPSARMNDSPTILEPRKMKRVMYLHHSLGCSCYVCTHPKIIPTVLRFYCLQARLASCSKRMIESGKILEATNRYHLKSMLRVLSKLDENRDSWRYLLSSKAASELMNTVYRDFFVQPGITTQMTKLEMMPAMDVKESVLCFNQVMEGLRLSNNDGSVHASIPLEAISAVVFQAAFGMASDNIKRGNIRDLLDEAVEKCEFLDAHSPEPTKEIPSDYCKILPKRAAAKGFFSDSDEDDNLPEAEVFDVSPSRKKIPPPFRLDDDDDEEEEEDVNSGGTDSKDESVVILSQLGPSRNTRSRANLNHFSN